MFDESFFVALAFATVIGAFLYLKLPQRVLAALDAKSAEIADELDQARKLRAEAEALLADYEERRKNAEKQAEEIVTEARATAQRMADEARTAMQAQLERRTQQAESKIARAEEQLVGEVRTAITRLAVDAAAQLIETGMSEQQAAMLVDQNITELKDRLQ
ncbi:MAG TPA: ATP F0F1 synthase subunit B [Rhodobiaceae bacterium]|nr:MAG: ATP synthase subunit b [Rhodobiaceae bacterium UBA7378]HCQ81278.1 ATP F0F1 synthase subunit B [Rhodobiaceae bacterium]